MKKQNNIPTFEDYTGNGSFETWQYKRPSPQKQ